VKQRRLRLTLGYRGTRYAGWAVQSRSHLPTIQATLEDGLAHVLGQRVRVVAAGRTDAGVHAEAQVVSFDTTSRISCDGLHRLLARRLPDDLWMVDVSEAPEGFDARRSALRRWYRYAIWRATAAPSSMWQGRCLPRPEPLNLSAMREAACALLGRHDFASLVTRPSARGSTERTVFAADWLELSASLLVFEICADAFLKQMVRTIVGSLLWVGNGRWAPEQFIAALAQADRRAAGPNAPAVGLTLHRIEY
jgi:tRNA pseudouridine38-40 synthase